MVSRQVSRQAARLVAGAPAIAAAHFAAEADPFVPGGAGGYVNLGTAENRLVWDLLAPRLRAARPVGPQDTRYAPLFGTRRLREVLAGFLSAYLSRAHAQSRSPSPAAAPVDADDLIVVSGATAALDVIASVLCDPGEAIVVPTPYYGALDTDLTGRSGARLLRVAPAAGDGPVPAAATVGEAVTRARAAGLVVRALAITSPHNPLGTVLDAGALERYARVCAALDLDLVSDEIYANSVFGAARFTSVLDLPGGVLDPGRRHVVWGPAKDFGLPGLKVGVLHTRAAAVRAAARELAYFAPVSTDTQWLLADLLADTDWVTAFLGANRARLAASYAAVAGALDEYGIPYLPAVAGFSVWTDLRPWLGEASAEGERALWRRLFADGRVSILPGGVFHSPAPGWFRLCHTTDPAVVREGVARLGRVLGVALRPAPAAAR